MADSEWLQTLICLDPHEPKNAEVLQYIGVDQWRDRICSDPLYGSGKTQLYPNDLPMAYLLCLFGVVTYKQVSTHIGKIPGFWDDSRYESRPHWEPSWIPGYATFLKHLPPANQELELFIDSIEKRASDCSQARDLVTLMYFHPKSEALKRFCKMAPERRIEDERRQAICQQDYELRRKSISELLRKWSYYPLLCSILPQSLGRTQLRQILDLLDLPTFIREAGLVEKFKTPEDLIHSDESLVWPRNWVSITASTLLNLEYAARWSIGCALLDPEMPWRINFSDALEKLDASKADMSPSTFSPLRFLTFCCLGPATTEFMAHQIGCLKAAAQRFLSEERPSSTHSREDFDIIAEWDSSQSAWIVTWKDEIEAQVITKGTKDMDVFFDALITSEVDPNRPMDSGGHFQWKVNTAELVRNHWSKIGEAFKMGLKERVDDNRRPTSWERDEKELLSQRAASEIEKKYFDALRQVLYRARLRLVNCIQGKAQQRKFEKVYQTSGKTIWTSIDPYRVFVNKSNQPRRPRKHLN